MGDQIGVSTAIKPEILKRLWKKHWFTWFACSYYRWCLFSSFDALEDGQGTNAGNCWLPVDGLRAFTLPQILQKYQENSPIMERLADQKYTLENMIEFWKKHQKTRCCWSKTDFEGLLAEFNKIERKDATTLNQKPLMQKLLRAANNFRCRKMCTMLSQKKNQINP